MGHGYKCLGHKRELVFGVKWGIISVKSVYKPNGDKFSRIYIKPYVVNLLLKCLVEVVLIMVHKVCFQWDI